MRLSIDPGALLDTRKIRLVAGEAGLFCLTSVISPEQPGSRNRFRLCRLLPAESWPTRMPEPTAATAKRSVVFITGVATSVAVFIKAATPGKAWGTESEDDSSSEL